jgi:hypothetical protein
MHFLHIAFCTNFPFFEEVSDVTRNNGLVDPKYSRDLRLRSPYRFARKIAAELDSAVLRLIHDHPLPGNLFVRSHCFALYHAERNGLHYNYFIFILSSPDKL